MLVYRFFIPLAFIFTLLFYNSLYARDFNYKDLESFDTVNTVCSKNGGSINSIILESYNTLNISGDYLFNSAKTWYNTDSDINKNQLPYLLQSDNEEANAVFFYDFERFENTDQFRLHYKIVDCNCPYGKDSYGQCKEEILIYKDLYEDKSIQDICSNDGEIKNVTSNLIEEKVRTSYYPYNETTKLLYEKDYICGTGNQNVLYYLLQPNDLNESQFINKYSEFGDNGVCGSSTSLERVFINITNTKFTCNCPNGKDEWGRCLPINCPYPSVEDENGQCVTPEIWCQDGGYAVNGSCDRSCDDIGLFTKYVNPTYIGQATAICVDAYPCQDALEDCVSQCGNKDNVEKFDCHPTLGIIKQCTCKDSNLDTAIPDEDEIDENTPNDEVTNSLLQSIKRENQKQNQTLGDIESLLTQSNENDLTRETQLNSIDGKLSNIDGSLSNIDDSINNLDIGLDEANQHLTNIENTNQNVSDFVDSLEGLQADTIQDDIGDNLSILDDIMSQYSTAKDNLTAQYETIVDLGEDAKTTINGGFTSVFTSYTANLTECSQTFDLNFPYVEPMTISIDPCYFTSPLKVFFYPIFYLIFTASVFGFAFSMFRGVL